MDWIDELQNVQWTVESDGSEWSIVAGDVVVAEGIISGTIADEIASSHNARLATTR